MAPPRKSILVVGETGDNKSTLIKYFLKRRGCSVNELPEVAGDRCNKREIQNFKVNVLASLNKECGGSIAKVACVSIDNEDTETGKGTDVSELEVAIEQLTGRCVQYQQPAPEVLADAIAEILDIPPMVVKKEIVVYRTQSFDDFMRETVWEDGLKDKMEDLLSKVQRVEQMMVLIARVTCSCDRILEAARHECFADFMSWLLGDRGDLPDDFFARWMMGMGGYFIKFAQFLSKRADLVPNENIRKHLAKAFEEVPARDWVAVKELKLSYYIGETLLFTIYTHYGNLI